MKWEKPMRKASHMPGNIIAGYSISFFADLFVALVLLLLHDYRRFVGVF